MSRLATTVTKSQKIATQRSDECGQVSSDSRMPAPTPWATIKSVTISRRVVRPVTAELLAADLAGC